MVGLEGGLQPVTGGQGLCGVQVGKAWPVVQFSSESFRSSAVPCLSSPRSAPAGEPAGIGVEFGFIVISALWSWLVVMFVQ